VRVYHFLPEKEALNNLSRKRIKLSSLEDMNDPFELLALALKKQEHRKALQGFKAKISRRWGAICLSRSWDNPMLWSHYADKHRGICLGFDVPDRKVVPVTYDARRLEVDLDRALARPGRDETLGLRLMTTKYEGWVYEDEVRLFVALSESDLETGMYFYDFGKDVVLKEIILGARSKLTRPALAKLLGKDGPLPKIVKTKIAFDSFTVVSANAKTQN
jgi:hypothetical protein